MKFVTQMVSNMSKAKKKTTKKVVKKVEVVDESVVKDEPVNVAVEEDNDVDADSPETTEQVDVDSVDDSADDDGTVVLKSNHKTDLILHTGVKLAAGSSVRVDAKVLGNYVIGCWLKAKVIEVQKG